MVNRRLRVAIASAAVMGSTVLGATGAIAATPLPAHVFAPYFEAWTTDSIATLAQQSGDRYLTLAFLETLSKTSCTLAWNGSSSQTVVSTPHPFLADITALRSGGGDVIPSFGGWSADQGGTEIGDSCKDPALIAAAYEGVVTIYGVTRLDLDIEGRPLAKPDGIDRRNKAVKLLQDWATATGRPGQSQDTPPPGPTKISSLSMWAIQRDNGGCPGSTGSNDCSGIVQGTWDFPHAMAPFSGP